MIALSYSGKMCSCVEMLWIFKDQVFYQSHPSYVMKANKLFDFSFRRLITDSKVKLKYQHLITNSFVEVSFYIFPLNSMLIYCVELSLSVYGTMSWYSICHYSSKCNRLLKWCPAPDCHHVVKVQYPDAKPVRCKCGRQFW